MNERILTAVEIEVIDKATKALQEIQRSFKENGDEVRRQKSFLAQHKDELEKVSKEAGVMGAAILGSAFLVGRAAQEQIQANQQLDAVLRSTKGAAGVTAEAAKELASSLQDVTNYGDETILTAENLLLTFTNIKKDVFPQATETVLNMSAALGQDLKSSAVQLGKALQDPINGVNALRRVGVNFSESQKKMIEQLVATGKGMEAQKMILKELEVEFGGSARAITNPLTQLKNALGDVAEELGAAFLPAVKQLAADVIPVVKNVGEWIKANPALVSMIAKTVLAIGAALVAFSAIGMAIAKLTGVWLAFKAALIAMAPVFGTTAAGMTAMLGPIGIIIAGVTAIVAVHQVLKAKAEDAWNKVQESVAESTRRYASDAEKWAAVSGNLTGNEQKYASIRQKLAWHMAESVRLSEAQIEQYRLGGSKAAIQGFQEQMDYHNKMVKQLGDEALKFSQDHNVNTQKVIGDFRAMGDATKETERQFDSGMGGAGDSVKELKKKVADLRKEYQSTVVDVNRKLLELKTNHKKDMKEMEKSIADVEIEMQKLSSAYKKSTQEILDAHNKMLAGLTEDKATAVIDQLTKIKELQQSITDATAAGGASADQLVTVIENRQDKGKTLSARDKQAFNVSDDTEEQINRVLELRREQEALVKVLNDNYTISKELKSQMNQTYGAEQIKAIEAIVKGNQDLDKSFKFSNLTEIEKTFTQIAKRTNEENADFTKTQTEKNQNYTEELFNLRRTKKELEDKKEAAVKAYDAERAELIKSKKALQEFATTYIDNLTNVEKVTTEKLDSMKAKLEELKNVIASMDALLQRRADITGGGTITQAAQAPRARAAKGDVFVKPTEVLLAEGGMSEAVVPLPDGRSIPVKMDAAPTQPTQNVIHVDMGGVTIANDFDLRKVAQYIVNAIDNQLLQARA